MSTPATEITVLTLKPDALVEDVSTQHGQIFSQLLKTVSSQAGFQRQYWGRQLENPNHLVLSVDWDDVSSHRTWMQSPSYQQFLDETSPILDSSGANRNLIHVNCEPHPPDAPRSSPVTEFAFFALARSAEETHRAALEEAVAKLGRTCVGTEGETPTSSSSSGLGATGFATGWVREELDHHDGTDEPAITLALILGWASKDAHLHAKQAQAFHDAVGPVRQLSLPYEKGRTMYHVSFTRAS